MTINTSQNVGIGTASPLTPLHVVGAIQSQRSGATQYARMINSSGTATFISDNQASGTYTGFQFQGLSTASGTPRDLAAIDGSGNLSFNSGYGSVATAYGCRAWINFNGTGTPAIRASGNVTSITDNGTGDYTVNFTTALADANYAVSGAAMQGLSNSNFFFGPVTSAPTTSAFRFITLNTSFSFTDSLYVSLAFHR
jgi:hypothetical protein